MSLFPATRVVPPALVALVLVPALALATLAACSTAAPVSALPVATNTVNLPKSYRFEPAAITVPAGTTVTWTNADNFSHTVRITSTGEVIGQMAPGESLPYTFEVVGQVPYDCSLHPNDMQGTVLVTPSS